MKKAIVLLVLCLSLSASAEAGILVMKNGNVFQGRILKDDVTKEFLTMRWPYKDFRGFDGGDIGRGFKRFESNRIRWYDISGDDLTDAYFKDHVREVLDARFHDRRKFYEEAQKGRAEVKVEEIIPLFNIKRGVGIVAVPIVKVHFEIRKPEGWLTKDIPVDKKNKGGDAVFTIVAPEAEKGFAARIHVVSVPLPKVSMSDQKEWYVNEVKKLTSDQVLDYRERARETPIGARRKDITMTTMTRRGSRNIMILRFIKFRRERVYFVTCFAHEEDFPKLRKLLKACVSSLVIYEDERGD
jgi:hypothetical protein